MIIWRSVGVQALAGALSIWADRQAGKSATPPRAAVPDPAIAPERDGDRRSTGGEPRIVHNGDWRS